MEVHTYLHLFKSGTVARVTVRLPSPGQRVSIPYLIRWNRTPLPGDAPEYEQWREQIAGDFAELARREYRMVDSLPAFIEEAAK